MKVKYTLEKRLEILDEWKKANNGSRNALARKYDVASQTIRGWEKIQELHGDGALVPCLHKLGYTINHKTVLKLMNCLGLFCCVRIKKYNSYKGDVGKIAPNILNRNFKADKPNQKWVTDISEISFCGQKTYLSVILDLFNREIISYDLSDHANMMQINHTLEEAFRKIPDNTKLILHSDQGWQYQMEKYGCALSARGVTQSISRRGNCLDNASMESFFGTLKSGYFHINKFASIEELEVGLVDYIRYYNCARTKLRLKGMSPVDYRETFVAS